MKMNNRYYVEYSPLESGFGAEAIYLVADNEEAVRKIMGEYAFVCVSQTEKENK